MDDRKMDECIVCGESAVTRSVMTQQFAYVDGGRDILLTADIPVERCANCGETLVGPEGELARHEVICHYLGRLTPSEIKEIRKARSLSQDRFADEVGVGLASIKRWETGAVIQSAAMDKLLRAAGGVSKPKKRHFTPVFRTGIKDYMLTDAKRFRLRPGV